jgi:hypothetical protein
MRLIVALILIFLLSCDNRNSGQLSLKNSFDTCGNHSDKKDLRVYRLTDMEFKIPSTNNPIDEICKSIWILDGIKLSVDD